MHYFRWRTHGDPNKVLRKLKPKRKKPLRKQSEVDAVIKLRNEGLAFSAIGAQLGMTKNAAFALWRRNRASE